MGLFEMVRHEERADKGLDNGTNSFQPQTVIAVTLKPDQRRVNEVACFLPT